MASDNSEIPSDWRERESEFVDQFVKCWEEAWEQRQVDLSPEELCPNGPPDLLAAIAVDIGRIKRFPLPEVEDGCDSVRHDTRDDFSSEQYVGIRQIGVGGQGTVVLVRDVDLDREVAVKHVRQRSNWRPDAGEQLQQEARIAGNLEHPGVVPIYGFGHDAQGQPYYAMRYVPKERTFEDVIREIHQEKDTAARDTRIKKALQKFVTICRTIAYAHRKGVVHGDIKPANVVVGNFGEVFVVDWGLARDDSVEAATDATDDSSGAKPGQLSGTLGYMSPERASGADISELSDVYSLGATLYQILTDELPYDGESVPEILVKVQAGKFKPPREINPAVPRALDAVCLKAMAEDPQSRYENSGALADDIESWLYDRPITAWPAPWYERARLWTKRHPRIASSAAAALLVGVVTLSIASVMLNAARERVIAANEELATSLHRNQFLHAASVSREGDANEAAAILDATDPSRRGVESNYVRRLLGNPQKRELPRLQDLRRFAVSADHSRIAVGGESLFSLGPRETPKFATTVVFEEPSRKRNEVIVADPTTGRVDRAFYFGQALPSEVFLAPDGRQIAFSGALGPERQQSVQVYAVGTGDLLWRQDHSEDQHVLFDSFGNDQDFFTTSGSPGAGRSTWELQRWSVTNGEALEPTAHKGQRLRLVNVKQDNAKKPLELYRPFDGSVIRTLDLLPYEGEFRKKSAVSDDGQVAVVVKAASLAARASNVPVEEYRVIVWPNNDESSWYVVADGAIHAIVFSQDSSLLAFADERSIQVWDTKKQCLTFKAANRATDARFLTFLGNDTLIIPEHHGVLWSWKTNATAVKSLGATFRSPVDAVLAGKDGNQLIVVDENCGIQLWDLEQNTLQAEYQLLLSHKFMNTRDIAVARSKSLLAIEHSKGVAIVDTTTGNVVRNFPDLRGPIAMVLDDSALLAFKKRDVTKDAAAAAAMRDQRPWLAAAVKKLHPVVVDLAEVDSPSFGEYRTAFLWPPEERIRSLVANASGTLIAAASDNEITIQALQMVASDKDRRATLNEHERAIVDQSKTVSGHSNWEPIVLPFPSDQHMTPLAFRPDSRQLVTTLPGVNTVRIFDTATWEHIDLTGHLARVTDAFYSADERRLYTSSQDGTIKIWDPTRGVLLWTIRDTHAPVFKLGYSVRISNLVGVTYRQDWRSRGDARGDILLWTSRAQY